MKRLLHALLLSIAITTVMVYFSKAFRDFWQKDLNIVLISVDTVRPDHLSTYGYDRNTDPNLKKLAEKSIVFQNAFTLIPQTYPSFAMLFTGKSPLTTGIFSNASPQNAALGELFRNTKLLSAETETLATILQKNGYYTVSFITSGILDDAFTGLSQGFDSYNQFSVYDINEWKQNRELYDAFIEKGTDWFAENKQQKFFYWIHLMDPHSPYYPPQVDRCLFQSEENCQMLQTQSFDKIDSFKSPYYACSAEEAPVNIVDRYVALYDAELASSDRQVGKILDALEKNNLMNNTIIIYYGDHGESFEHHYYFAHGESLYDSTIRIPLVIYDPLKKAKQIIKTRITNVDILPTILDLVHIPYTKNQFDGESMLNNNSDATIDGNDYVYFSNYNLTKFAVMKGQYKYIASQPSACILNGVRDELYDIVSDPEEKRNLVTIESGITEDLSKALEKYFSNMKRKPPLEKQDKNDRILEELKSLGY